jgi:hypothetical protein
VPEDGDVISMLICLLLAIVALILLVLVAPGAGRILKWASRSGEPGQGNHTSARRGSPGVIDFRWELAWPDSVARWCFWASSVALIGVFGMLVVGAAAARASGGGAEGVILKMVQIGFAGAIGLFLLGVALVLIRSVSGARTGGRPS